MIIHDGSMRGRLIRAILLSIFIAALAGCLGDLGLSSDEASESVYGPQGVLGGGADDRFVPQGPAYYLRLAEGSTPSDARYYRLQAGAAYLDENALGAAEVILTAPDLGYLGPDLQIRRQLLLAWHALARQRPALANAFLDAAYRLVCPEEEVSGKDALCTGGMETGHFIRSLAPDLQRFFYRVLLGFHTEVGNFPQAFRYRPCRWTHRTL